MYAEDKVTVVDRREMLRVKIKSLAEEARIIRREEKRAGKSGQLYGELRNHRVGVVRREARAAHLAYGFIKGRPYEQMESTVHQGNEAPWAHVEKLVKRYGPAGLVVPKPHR